MITLLKVVYAVVLIVMIAVTAWSGMHESILAVPPVVLNDVWFKATLLMPILALCHSFFGFATEKNPSRLKSSCFLLLFFWATSLWQSTLLSRYSTSSLVMVCKNCLQDARAIYS